jgi:acetyl-CoA carboxylase biotin carboxyl carrier protein
MANDDKDLQRIKDLIEIMKQNGLVELEIKHGDDVIVLKRQQPQSLPVAVPITGVSVPHAAGPGKDVTAAEAAQHTAHAAEGLVDIKSPIVGTFYATPSPDSDPFVEIGSQVNSQTVVCIVEAMKVMNEIKADTSGTIEQICMESGQAVEYGQVLFRVRPD